MDLNHFSKEQLVSLARLLEEQERAYSGNKLELYKPHDKQLPFHKSDKMIRLMVSGNRGGKTLSSVVEAIWLSLGIHPYHPRSVPCKGKFYGESFAAINEIIIPKFNEWLPMSFLHAKKPYTKNQMGQIIGFNFSNGSVIRVGSYDQQYEKSEGTDYDFIAFDEPPPRELYISNLRATIDRGGIMWFSMTPLKEPWIFDELWTPGINGEKPYIDCFSWSSDQNPYLNKDALDKFLSELSDSEKEVRFHGRFAKLQGVVIDTYDPTLSDIEPFDLDENYSIYEGIDPHARKPNGCLWKAIDKDGFRFVVRELYFDGGIYDFGQEIARVRRELRSHGAEVVRSVADTSLNQVDMMFKINQRQELMRSLKDAGETLFPALAQKRDWLNPGIQKLRDLFRPVRHPNLDKLLPMEFLFKGMVPRYKWELGHYQWPANLADQSKPKDINNDLIDCSRYIESIAPYYQTPGQTGIIKPKFRPYERLSHEERVVANRFDKLRRSA